MNNIFCLSFSDIGVQLLNVISDDNENTINSHHQFIYPSPKSSDQIFTRDNIPFIAESVLKFKTDNAVENFSLSFALPFNFADIKKVAFPLESNKTLKKEQIEWELNTTLPGELKDYKISVLNETNDVSYSSAVVVAIKKSLLNMLQQIAEECQSEIKSVFLSCFAIENYIMHDMHYRADKNFTFVKVSKNILEYHFYSGKQHYISQIDFLDLSSRNREEIIVELTHERYKKISNLFDQTMNKNPFELYLYGSFVDEKIIKALNKGLSIPVELAHIENFPDKNAYKYIEAWGSVL